MKWSVTGRVVPQEDGSFLLDLHGEVDGEMRVPRKAAPTIAQLSEKEICDQIEDAKAQMGTTLAALADAMCDLMASGNKRGRVSISRLLREVYRPLALALEKHEPSALCFGMEQAVAKAIPNVNYAKKAAASYDEQPVSAPVASRYTIEGNQ